MVLLGVKAGMDMVHVRLDDLDQAGKGQVHDAVKTVHRLLYRATPGLFAFFGFLITALVVFTSIVSTRTVGGRVSLYIVDGIAVVCLGAVVSTLAWAFASMRLHHLNQADRAALAAHVQESVRCREFVEAYLAASPSSAPYLVEQPKLVKAQ